MFDWLSEWVHRTDGWSWVKLGSVAALALVAGLLRRRQIDEQRAETIAKRALDRNKKRFVDPFES